MARLFCCGSLLVWALVATGCGSDAPQTTLRLRVAAEAGWSLTAYDYAVGGGEVRTEDSTSTSPEIVVVIDDDAAGRLARVEVWGIRDGLRYAYGRSDAMPILGEEVIVNITLAQVQCGDWCVPGATRCRGDGVMTCVEMPGGCTAWQDALACENEQVCSLGRCADTCVDECAAGETRCDGPSGVQICGQFDNDDCLEWQAPVACTGGDRCSHGSCAPGCSDECALGDTRCSGTGVEACGDLNLDGCLEWGPVNQCDQGQSCTDGICRVGCSDECTDGGCEGSSQFQCGQFDFDGCTDRSPGVSCVPANACIDGSCQGGACVTEVRVCGEPPAPQCIGDSTLRVWDELGVCDPRLDGDCQYEYQDVDCPNCPDCDVCAAVTCDAPPSVCFEAAGSCDDGLCSYTFADGVACDDGDGCTQNDSCDTGLCAGEAIACSTPPPAACIDNNVLRRYAVLGACTAGACSYLSEDVICASGCEAGACVRGECVPTGWVTDVVDNSGDVGRYSSVAVNDEGVHISYYDDLGGNLNYAFRPHGGSFTTLVIDSVGDVGEYTSLYIDGSNGIHISYYDQTNQQLKYAYRPFGGSFQTSVVAVPEPVWFDTSLAVDPAGGVHIAFHIQSFQDLRYAYRAPGDTNFTVSTVASEILSGRYCSLAVDNDGGVHLSFDRLLGAVEYAYKPAGGSFSTQVVSDSGFLGYNNAIALDSQGGVHITYYSSSLFAARYAYRPPAGDFTIESVGPDGFYSSVFIDESDGVHVAYINDEDINYAYRELGGAFVTQTAVGSGGQDLQLFVDQRGQLHITHHASDSLAYTYLGCEE